MTNKPTQPELLEYVRGKIVKDCAYGNKDALMKYIDALREKVAAAVSRAEASEHNFRLEHDALVATETALAYANARLQNEIEADRAMTRALALSEQPSAEQVAECGTCRQPLLQQTVEDCDSGAACPHYQLRALSGAKGE